MNTRRLTVLSLALVVTVAATPGWAEQRAVYYVTVGNSFYKSNDLDILNSNEIAADVKEALDRAGAQGGSILKSTKESYLEHDVVMNEISKVADGIPKDSNSLFVYYFLGHGEVGKDRLSHISLLGSYPSNVESKPSSPWLVATKEITEALEKRNIPYILLMDNCYYRKLVGPGVIGAIDGLGGQIAFQTGAATSILNGMLRKGPQTIYHAAAFGQSAATVPDPSRPAATIGPLARRLLTIAREVTDSNRALTLRQFMTKMADRQFDPETVPGEIINGNASASDDVFLVPSRTTTAPGERSRPTKGGCGHGDGP